MGIERAGPVGTLSNGWLTLVECGPGVAWTMYVAGIYLLFGTLRTDAGPPGGTPRPRPVSAAPVYGVFPLGYEDIVGKGGMGANVEAGIADMGRAGGNGVPVMHHGMYRRSIDSFLGSKEAFIF